MKRPLVLAIAIGFLGGCAPTYTWIKSGASTSDYYRAKSHCEAVSTGATPMDYSNSGSSTTYHSGSVYGSNGAYGTYSGTSTTYNNNTGQAFANIGQAVRRQRMFNDCMRGQGFVPQEKKSSSYAQRVESTSSSSLSRRSYARDLKDWEEKPIDYNKAIVNFDNIKLLFRPTFKARELNTIEKGEEVEVLNEAASSWLKVSYQLQQGYVAKKWVTPTTDPDVAGKESEEEPSSSASSSPRQKTEMSGWYVTPSDFSRGEIENYEVTVRATPDASSDVKAILQRGQKISVLNTAAEEWLRIKAGEIEGYVRASGVKPL